MADNYFNLIQLIFGKRWLDAFSSSLKSLPFSHHSFHSLFIQIETLINCLCLHTFQWFIQLINNHKCVCFHCIGVKGIDLLLLWKMSHLHAIHLPLHSWRTNWIFIDLATICIYVIRLRDLQNHLVIVNVHFRDDFFLLLALIEQTCSSNQKYAAYMKLIYRWIHDTKDQLKLLALFL